MDSNTSSAQAKKQQDGEEKQSCCWKPRLRLGISSAQESDISGAHSISSGRLPVFKGLESVQKTRHLYNVSYKSEMVRGTVNIW